MLHRDAAEEEGVIEEALEGVDRLDQRPSRREFNEGCVLRTARWDDSGEAFPEALQDAFQHPGPDF